MTASKPTLSVVVASAAGGDFLLRCLDSLVAPAARAGAEVIVVDRCGPGRCEELGERYPGLEVIAHPGPARPGVPELRAVGVDASRAAIVAVIEEHCVAPPTWIDTILRNFREGDAAIGGPILDDRFRRVRDWVVYFCEYHNDLPPWAPGPRTWINDANAAYARDQLLAHRSSIAQSYWAISLHPRLLAAGSRLRAVPEMGVRHTGPFDYGYYLHQRYLLSRVWGGTQRSRVSLGRCLLHLAAGPVFPLFLLTRITLRVIATHDARLLRALLQALPLLVPAVIAFTCGEWLGYLLGPGRALEKVE